MTVAQMEGRETPNLLVGDSIPYLALDIFSDIIAA